jgi:hypothetical protein
MPSMMTSLMMTRPYRDDEEADEDADGKAKRENVQLRHRLGDVSHRQRLQKDQREQRRGDAQCQLERRKQQSGQQRDDAELGGEAASGICSKLCSTASSIASCPPMSRNPASAMKKST